MASIKQRRADLIARVKWVLANAGVPPISYAKALSSVIGVAIAQAYKKLSGASVFTLPQIEAIEFAYGVELLAVPQDPKQTPVRGSRNLTNATFVVAGHSLPCQIILGAARSTAGRRFAAFLHRGEWFVCLTIEYSGNAPLFEVEVLNMIIDE